VLINTSDLFPIFLYCTSIFPDYYLTFWFRCRETNPGLLGEIRILVISSLPNNNSNPGVDYALVNKSALWCPVGM